MGQLANGTDITFTRPPATASTWTSHDFTDLHAGGPHTSIHTPDADLESSVFIADAHATIFAAQPSTQAHLSKNQTTRYLAPNGTLRGFVDYRVRYPNTTTNGNRSVDWSLTSHQITNVTLTQDGQTIATAPGSHTPVLHYQLDDAQQTKLTLHATIHVRVQKTVRVNGTVVDVTTKGDSLTVSDSLAGSVYNLSASPYYATYPNGDAGVAIFQSAPWQGYTLTKNGSARVRGVWRFYTARNTSWDTLVKSTRDGDRQTASDSIPVFVHAYPSRIGPVAEPVRTGPSIITTWGTNRSSPSATLGPNIHIDIVNRSYTTTYGLAVRADHVDRQALHVAGIVRGVNASIVQPQQGSKRQLRRSNLTAHVVSQNASQATVRVELHDNKTGAPIVLNQSGRYPIFQRSRDGYITVGGKRVTTNESGVAMVTLHQPGIYTARYHPESWLGTDPAYVSDRATVRWHPLGTLGGWLDFIVAVGWRLIPFAVMFYAGLRLLRMLGAERYFSDP
ncbi:hypothetical protein GCM10009021_28250 [Halarchaeum nitratireducens]|uniref:Uncharacterized protein n=1 Tax=Halarchaeum nitratireducens TaxID=489913 RepID=A0A830GFU9_9EURY|nr:hypothetical protein [Halarchaeum nitratireducens]GGN24743.1 hypothetical protein GCM10009021_28250 [Halarchaeum nitratireducens]